MVSQTVMPRVQKVASAIARDRKGYSISGDKRAKGFSKIGEKITGA
jgi:hypothetical protein